MQDILIDASSDIYFADGDFAFGNSDEQHINHIVIAQKGNYRQHPLVGVGIAEWISSPNSAQRIAALQQRIRLQLDYDGYKAKRIDLAKGIENINITANR